MVQTGENAFRPKCFLLLDQILATKVSDIPVFLSLYGSSDHQQCSVLDKLLATKVTDIHVLWSLYGIGVHQQCSVLDQILATKVSGFPCPLEFVWD